ncbi:rhodanese-like domain-containing protein [Hymenobacter sp. NST-14]|uniref:rhodanese-like domain-containing protein n=1 Tax=Hymenobacter piscis TaxID=2839984 RepID=UPI001C0094E0|nr:rhodanese-like domain-containing protein [Hymenobacter piscis]MBT9392448.1 rhodanese-like domain-containing protein [Hymenobacter piscis]
MKRFLLAGACTLISVAAAAQSTNIVRETKVERAMTNGSPGFVDTGAVSNPTVPVTPVAEVKKTLAQPNVVLLDVRTPEEYATGHLPGAGNLNFRAPDVAEQLQKLDPNKTYVVYCASGNRSNKTAVLMQEKGFQHVVNAGAYKDLKDDIK